MKDRKDEDLTAEPEMLRRSATRGSWGFTAISRICAIDCFLHASCCMRSGIVFVQISDENLHHVAS